MRAIDRKLVRDLWQSKGLLLAIACIVAVGVNNFVTLQSAYQNLANAQRDYYRQCRMADFWIDVKKVPLADLQALDAIPAIVEITPRIQFRALVDLDEVAEPINALVLSLPDRRQTTLNDIVLRQGTYFTANRENEVILTESFARKHRLRIGQRIHLLLNNRRQELIVTGTALSSEFTYPLGPGTIVPDSKRFGVFYVKQRFAEAAFDFRGAANQICGKLSANVGPGAEDALRRAETLLDPYGVFAVTPLRLQASNQFLSNEIQGLGAIATISPTVFLTVAALVLNILLTRMVRQQRTVVGTLKALGYSDATLAWHFLKYGLGVGLAGGVVGCVCGLFLAAFFTRLYHQFFEFPELDARFYGATIVQGLVASVLFAIGGAVQGVRNVLRLQPAEAMRSEPPRRGGAIAIEKLPFLWNRFTSTQRMVLRSIFRNRFRTLTGLFAASMGAGLLVHSFMLVAGQDFMIEFQFFRVTHSDVDITFSDERGDEVLRELAILPGVDYFEPFLEVACTFEHGHARRKASVTGLVDRARLTTPRDQWSRPIEIPDSGLVINRQLADILQVKVGDVLRMTPVKGQRRTVEVRVARITDSFMGLNGYANLTYLSRLVGEPFAASGAQLQVNPRAGELQLLYRELKRMPAVQSIQVRREMIANLVRTLLEGQYLMIIMSVIFSGVAFFGSIVNASMVNLAERQREVATFAALGYTRWQIGGMFLRENLATSLLGTLLGLPFGRFVMWLTAMAYNNDLLRLPIVGPPWVWRTTLLLAVAFSLAAHAVTQWSIHKMNLLQALNVRE